MFSSTTLSGGYRFVRRYMEKTYCVDMERLRLEGAEQLPAARGRLEAKPRVPLVRPVALVRDEEREVGARAQRGAQRALDHGRAESASAVLLERRDLVDLRHAAVLEQC